MAKDDTSTPTSIDHLLLIASATAAFIVALYHCLTFCWLNRHSRRRRRHSMPEQEEIRQAASAGLDGNFISKFIPAHKFQKADPEAILLPAEDGVCAICLCEFEEGEELRALPECGHSFHVACIDMWLYSHSTCPICRSAVTPSTELLGQPSDSN
ncbi:RING-H2 finger protein ATL64-like [Diospyros lotus]|uniref:RING-H2 finger protein ATL64-like n=1 Tax=Diospyros lotus TaxID=55363 RepID=UPI00224FB96C|nr:RING-H2 finger protein ATL64-like [Diospyros lotus]